MDFHDDFRHFRKYFLKYFILVYLGELCSLCYYKNSMFIKTMKLRRGYESNLFS